MAGYSGSVDGPKSPFVLESPARVLAGIVWLLAGIGAIAVGVYLAVTFEPNSSSSFAAEDNDQTVVMSILFGLVGLGAAAYYFITGPEVASTFDRTTGKVSISKRWAAGLHSSATEIDFDQVVDTGFTTYNGRIIVDHALLLKTKSGSIPVTGRLRLVEANDAQLKVRTVLGLD